MRKILFASLASFIVMTSACLGAESNNPPKQCFGNASTKMAEFLPWNHQNAGPAKNKNAFLFLSGWTGGQERESWSMVPYLTYGFLSQGYDLFGAKFPNGPHERSSHYLDNVADYVARKTQELKAQGYERVIVGGQSWGAWISLLAQSRKNFVADAVFSSAPNPFGARTQDYGPGGEGGKPNPCFRANLTEFPKVLENVRVPTVIVLPKDDFFDPFAKERGAIATKVLDKKKIPNLVLTEPAAFTGHFAAYIPFFGFAYGECIRHLLITSQVQKCDLPDINNKVFDSAVMMDETLKAGPKIITSFDQIKEKHFIAYRLGKTDDNREFFYEAPYMTARSVRYETKWKMSFENQRVCLSEGGPKRCFYLLAWPNGNMTQYDEKTRIVTGWWLTIKQ